MQFHGIKTKWNKNGLTIPSINYCDGIAPIYLLALCYLDEQKHNCMPAGVARMIHHTLPLLIIC